MFLGLPLGGHHKLQQVALVLNTVLLIAMLIVIEVAYSETPKEKRAHLRYFFPLALALIGLLLYTVYAQVKGA